MFFCDRRRRETVVLLLCRCSWGHRSGGIFIFEQERVLFPLGARNGYGNGFGHVVVTVARIGRASWGHNSIVIEFAASALLLVWRWRAARSLARLFSLVA